MRNRALAIALSLPLAIASVAGAQAAIDFSSAQQVIDGFGASSAWHGELATAELDAAFSNGNSNQLGLSILRVDIDPAGQSNWASQKTNATNAKARGAKYVLATPWSPQAYMKTNNNTVGGELSTGSYPAYAAYLSMFYKYMGNVDVISVQNEPNITVDYTSCTWSATQLYNFVKNNAMTIGAPVMMPETYNYDISYSDPVLNDATAAANIDYIGLHLYGATMKTYTNAIDKKKKIWMTEYYLDPEDIGTQMTMGQSIMDCLNNGMNAYIWWYLRMPNCNLVNSDGTIQNKGYIMGQFSKYVRPGYVRVSATYQPQSGVSIVAFKGTKNVIIALNQNTSAKSQTFNLSNGTFANAHRYTTSDSKKIKDDGTVAVANNSFTVSLDAQSLTTFVADATTDIDPKSQGSAALSRLGNRIMANGSDGVLRLSDLSGRIVRSSASVGGHVEMGLDHLRGGVYLAQWGGSVLRVVVSGD
jgi:glucuronoarabinoxylan endo-1,4-beta-xylanase